MLKTSAMKATTIFTSSLIKVCTQTQCHNNHTTNLEHDYTQAVLLLDFGEILLIFNKDEYQSAHWHKNQVTIFTAPFWHENECFPVLVVPSNLCQSKERILVFKMTLLKNLHPDDVIM